MLSDYDVTRLGGPAVIREKLDSDYDHEVVWVAFPVVWKKGDADGEGRSPDDNHVLTQLFTDGAGVRYVPLDYDATAIYVLRRDNAAFEAGVNFSSSVPTAIVSILTSMHRLWEEAFHFLLSVDIEVWSMLKRAVGEPGAVQLFNEVLKRGDGDTNNNKKKGSGWLH